jgi:hypothetical protein
MITAAHCIGQLAEENLVVAFEDGNIVQVIKVTMHDTADIAILQLEQSPNRFKADFFGGTSDKLSMGMEFFAYGYPEIPQQQREQIPPRVFFGIFQHFFDHQSHMHRRGDLNAPCYQYVAGELSIACPGGLSGGPIFEAGNPDVVLAIATENIKAMTLLDAIEETQGDGTQFRTEYNNVISYGVSLLVTHVAGWLDRIPPMRRVPVTAGFHR